MVPVLTVLEEAPGYREQLKFSILKLPLEDF